MIVLVLSCLGWQDGWKEALEVLPVSLAFGWWIECLVLHMRFGVGGGGGDQGPVCNSYKCLHKWYPAGNRKQNWQKCHQLLYRPCSSVWLQLVFPREWCDQPTTLEFHLPLVNIISSVICLIRHSSADSSSTNVWKAAIVLVQKGKIPVLLMMMMMIMLLPM